GLLLVQGSPVVLPGQFALIVPGGAAAASTAPLLETWHIAPATTVFACEWTGTHNLGNSGETIALRDDLGGVVDLATYPDLGANIGSVQVVVSALDATANDIAANWAQSSTLNADYCADPTSDAGADYGFVDNNPANDYWDGTDEDRDLGTPARYPVDLKYALRYAWNLGAPSVQSQLSVEAAVTAAVILTSPNADQLCAYDFPSPFPAGTRLTAADGSAPRIVLPATTWVVWIDDDPLAAFTHPTRVVLVDDATGAINVVNSGWWLEINDEPFFALEDERTCSPNNFYGACCAGIVPRDGGAIPVAALALTRVHAAHAQVASNACAIAISGSRETHFSKNVDNLMKALQDKGLLDAARTKKVKYPHSRLKDVCKAFTDLPADCDKLYVYVSTHGSRNHLKLPGGGISAKKLACKIKDKGVPNNCIVLQACKSGSDIDELKGKKIPGTVTTSADSSHSSYFEPGKYSFYTQYLIDCLKRAEITDLASAAAWAKQQLKKNRPRDKSNPQCQDLSAVGIQQDEGAEVPETGAKGEGFNYQFQAEGAPPGPLTWVLDPPALAPPGLSLAPTGLLAGVLLQAGQFDFSVRLLDCCTSNGVALPFTLQVLDAGSTAPPLTMDNEIAPALAGLPYAFPLAIEGGNPPYNVQIIYGALPPGFGLVPFGPEAGQIFGLGTEASESELTIQVQDSGVPPQFVVRNVDLSVVIANPRPIAPWDINYSGDIDASDWSLMEECMTGPVNIAPLADLAAECQRCDQDGDEDVDLLDASVFGLPLP
ncbi:MAG TPA: C13 family peptidase, partial [Phycisphaerae bacterium]|nr:C13 family peptidase [Phycisphaerae bacterium]